jgi:hypothetical protein
LRVIGRASVLLRSFTSNTTLTHRMHTQNPKTDSQSAVDQ